jgi:hypothetical protein
LRLSETRVIDSRQSAVAEEIGEAYINGMNGIAEGVRQLRDASVNPVPDVEHVLVTAGTGVPTSGLNLG